MRAPGYYAQVGGEALYIIKCVPVEVQPEKGPDCHQQLQVARNGETWFLQPLTHILVRTPMEFTCNDVTPSQYQLDNIWYKFLPGATETLPPRVIQPDKSMSWHYANPGNLGITGIYGTSDLRTLQQTLLFPMERHAILNILARRTARQPTNPRGYSFYDALDPEGFEKLATSVYGWLWGWFLQFSNVSSGIIGFLCLLHVIKTILSTIIRGYTLHAVFGWSMRLLAAIFSSTTHLLIQLNQRSSPATYEPVSSRGVVVPKEKGAPATIDNREDPLLIKA